MAAWTPLDSNKFSKAYLSGMTDYQLGVEFDSTPDKVGKYISRMVKVDMLPRRGTFIPKPLFSEASESLTRTERIQEFFTNIAVKPVDGLDEMRLDVARVMTGQSTIEEIREERGLTSWVPKESKEHFIKITEEASRLKEYPSRRGKVIEPYKGNPDNILVIGDTHLPFSIDGYLEFCRATQERFDCGTIIHIGDEIDNCAMSYHDSDPDGHGAGREAELAQLEINDWYAVFPEVTVLVGNHSALHFRKAFTSGIPKRFLKDYEQVWNAPEGWKWVLEHEAHGVYFTHGTGMSGERSAYMKALNRRQPVVQGHIHTVAGVMHNQGPKDNVWGMQVGCGVDEDAYSMAYAKTNVMRPVISCGVILDKGRIPLVIPM